MPWEPRIRDVPGDAGDILLERAKRRGAEEMITAKYNLLGGAPGAASGELVGVGIGYYRQYAKGRIYFNYHLANALYVHDAIGDRYAQLDGTQSWLGWPTADEQAFPQDGRVSTFEHGAIYWWPDTGAIELGNVSVQYKGLYCFGETTELSSADEPYVIFGVVPVLPSQPSQVMTQIYSDVDAGNARPDYIELYRGLPYGMALAVVLMENDQGDPNKYLDKVKQGVTAAGAAVTTACAAVPYVGPFLAIGCEVLFKEYGDDMAEIVNETLGTGDDLIEKWDWHVTAKEMVTMTRSPAQNFWGIEHHLQSKTLSDGDASYKVYLSVYAV